MIHFGFNYGFSGFHPYQPAAPMQMQPQPAASDAPMPAPAHVTTAAPVSYMTPAFMMAYPQMGYGGMASPPAGATGGSGHVTANPTNSTAAPQGAAGMPGYGMAGMYGMPVMMLAPVFLQFGYPVVFQGSQQQPSIPADPVPVEPPLESPPAPTEVSAPPPVVTEGPTVEVVPEPEEPALVLPGLPIQELSAADFAKYRSVEKAREQESSMSLELTTKDGDAITLQFRQIDAVEESKFRGRTLDGETVMDEFFREESDRVVNMDVVGELSDAEKMAIDAVLTTIIDVVNSFFNGDMRQAIDRLKAMDFNGEQLAELSLNLSMSKSVDIDKAYHNGADKLHQLKSRDGDVERALEFMATEQKRLVEMAKNFLQAPSAAKLVRSLVPPLMSEPFAELSEKITDAHVEPAPLDEAADEEDDA